MGRIRAEAIPGNYHVTLKVLQLLCLLIGDAGKNLIWFEPLVNIGNTDQSVSVDRDPSVMFEFPKNMVNGKVHEVLVEGVCLHGDTEFVEVVHDGGEAE
jgi:hypothetical protein